MFRKETSMKKRLIQIRNSFLTIISRIKIFSFRRTIADIRNFPWRTAFVDGKNAGVKKYFEFRTWVIATYNDYMARFHALDLRRQNRVIVLVLSLVFIGDYLMICYHTGRNPAGIFPSIPVLDFRKKITVYIPSPDGAILKETRLIQKSDDTEEYIKRLTRFVIDGSSFENTRPVTPIQGSVRKVWIHDQTCAIDIRLEQLEDDAPVMAGSENLFREALSKTIIENVGGVKSVIVLENGIPNKNIWESITLK
jgi:hypothetical protein